LAWNQRRIEKRLKDGLTARFGKDDGENHFSLYVRARQKLLEQVVPYIPAAEPSLTDHTGPHLANVLDNAFFLIYADDTKEKDKKKRLSAVELYSLCLSILFHDVGNVFERKEHEKRVAEVYDWVRAGESALQQERLIVVNVAGAHSGKNRTGGRDTIVDLFSSHLWGDNVRMREIGAILRFADELAEGPQRTSQFMQDKHMYDPTSEIYHQYAAITTVWIDRGNGRIALTYNIDVAQDLASSSEALAALRALLEFAYHRITKLNQERAYARHYCHTLDCFKTTEVSFNFWLAGRQLALDLPPLVLSDIIVPGEKHEAISSIAPAYELTRICELIRQAAVSNAEVIP
jgi:hypothetical protein